MPGRNRLDPPSWATAASKLTRVRSDGFSKISATVLPASDRPGTPRLRGLFQPGGVGQELAQLLGRGAEDVQEVTHLGSSE